MEISWKVYVPIVGVICLLVAGAAFFILQASLRPSNPSGIDPTLEMLMTLHVHQDEINTRVAAALATEPVTQNANPTLDSGTPNAPVETPLPTATVNTP